MENAKHGRFKPELHPKRDEWLLANRQTIDAKIRRGMEELDRGEGIPEDKLDAHLSALKFRVV